MRLSRLLFVLVAACTFAFAARPALALPPGYSVQDMHTGVQFTGALRFAPDGRLFTLETYNGVVRTWADSSTSSTSKVWATIPVLATGEHGLLGIAFHPNFPDSPFVYFYHSNESPLENRVVRMRDSAGVGVGYKILINNIAAASTSHESGRLAFGLDGALYITVGEQQNPANSQDLSTQLGKILRVGVVGQPLPDNPFGASSRVYAYGIRNAFGLCFDPANGNGYFTDNGPTCDDELNHLDSAVNYGWGPNDPCGGQPAGTQLGMYTVTPTIAPTGCWVYRGSRSPQLNGNVFFGGYNDRILRRVVLHPGSPGVADSVQSFYTASGGLLDVTQGPDGCLWFSSGDRLSRVVPPPMTLGVGAPSPAAWRVSPNPFGRSIALSVVGGPVLRAVEVWDASGRRVRAWDGPISGALVWDGRDAAGTQAPAGVYFVRGQSDAGTHVTRIVKLVR